MRFSKYSGLGNNFIMLDGELRDQPPFGDDLVKTVRFLCDVHFGMGADGVIFVCRDPLFMDIYNADGSRATMCGNGIRCMAKYCIDNDIVPEGSHEFDIEALSGTKHVKLSGDVGKDGDYLIEIGMGVPDFSARKLYIDLDGEFRKQKLSVLGRDIVVSGVSTGEVHVVVWLDDNDITDAVDPTELYNDEQIHLFGRALCFHPAFPKQANINFARVSDKDEITMITWERGVGMTTACGSGATAAAIMGMEEKELGSNVVVRLPYGELNIRLSDSGEAFMMGPATKLFTGEIYF